MIKKCKFCRKMITLKSKSGLCSQCGNKVLYKLIKEGYVVYKRKK